MYSTGKNLDSFQCIEYYLYFFSPDFNDFSEFLFQDIGYSQLANLKPQYGLCK